MTETDLTNLKINVMTEAQKDQTTFGANELIMTPDNSQSMIIDDEPTEGSTNAVSSGGVYDALLNRYQVKTIYDKDSSDPNINLGYTSGIHHNETANGTFDTNVKYFLVICRFNAVCFTIVYDPNTYSDQTYSNSFGQGGFVSFEDDNIPYNYTANVYISSSQIKGFKLGFYRNSKTLNTNDTFYITKIDAVY